MNGMLCVIAGLGLLMCLLAGGAVVRASCTISNRLLGPVREKVRDTIEEYDWDWDAEEEEKPPPLTGEKAVPEPSIGKAMMIASTGGVVNVFIALVFGVLAEGMGMDFDDGPGVA